jgi:pantetheine-phosphate adenylyltransferase
MYPGSFDPITLGHVDVIERAAQMFETVTVVIAKNSKKTPLFDEHERLAMAKASLVHLPNVAVTVHAGLVVDFANEHGVDVIVRGLRAVSDFEYEFQIALMNRKLQPNVSTIFLMPHERYTSVRTLQSSYHRQLLKPCKGSLHEGAHRNAWLQQEHRRQRSLGWSAPCKST